MKHIKDGNVCRDIDLNRIADDSEDTNVNCGEDDDGEWLKQGEVLGGLATVGIQSENEDRKKVLEKGSRGSDLYGTGSDGSIDNRRISIGVFKVSEAACPSLVVHGCLEKVFPIKKRPRTTMDIFEGRITEEGKRGHGDSNEEKNRGQLVVVDSGADEGENGRLKPKEDNPHDRHQLGANEVVIRPAVSSAIELVSLNTNVIESMDVEEDSEKRVQHATHEGDLSTLVRGEELSQESSCCNHMNKVGRRRCSKESTRGGNFLCRTHSKRTQKRRSSTVKMNHSMHDYDESSLTAGEDYQVLRTFRRKPKRYRTIEDLYQATQPKKWPPLEV